MAPLLDSRTSNVYILLAPTLWLVQVETCPTFSISRVCSMNLWLKNSHSKMDIRLVRVRFTSTSRMWCIRGGQRWIRYGTRWLLEDLRMARGNGFMDLRAFLFVNEGFWLFVWFRFLSYVDLLGTTYSASTLATGYGSYIAQPLLRKAVEGNEDVITEDEAVRILEQSMKVLFYRDARSLNKVCLWTFCITSNWLMHLLSSIK